jgi:hypothetical protein
MSTMPNSYRGYRFPDEIINEDITAALSRLR